MAAVPATKTHGYALLAASRDPRLIDQHGTIGVIADGVTYDFAGIANLVVNVGLISNTAPNGIAVDLERNGFVLNAGTIEATGAGGVGVRIVSRLPAGSGAAVINSGTISGRLDGIDLPAGGLLINTTGGLIEGGRYGIDVSSGPGTITDAGTIEGGTDAIAFSGSFADRVVLERGAVLDGKVIGGSGTNTLELAAVGAGTLSAFAGEFTGFGIVTVATHADWTFSRSVTIGNNVFLTDSGTPANAGQIDTGIQLTAGASLHNSGTIDAGMNGFGDGLGSVDALYAASASNSGLIAGGDGSNVTGSAAFGRYGALGIDFRATGTLSNTGTIQGGAGGDAAGNVEQFGGNGSAAVLLIESGTVTNTGSLLGGAGGNATEVGSQRAGGGLGSVAVAVNSVGLVTNSGTILAGAGGYAQGEYATGGSGGTALELTYGRIVNSGVIIGGAGGFGNGDVFSAGGAGGAGIFLSGFATIINSGTIAGGAGGSAGDGVGGGSNGADGIAVELQSGGLMINAAGGLIESAGIAIGAMYGPFGPSTIVDAGTISGGIDAAVFSGTYDNRVILDAGARLIGQVVGGSGIDTLELAAGGSGTLSAFAGEFVNFNDVTVDAGADWRFSGSDPLIGDGVIVTVSGTLDNAGRIDSTVTLTTGASLQNTGTILGSSGSYPGLLAVNGQGVVTITNSGAIDGAPGRPSASAFAEGEYGGGGIALGSSGMLTNSGTIQGGAGGTAAGSTDQYGGDGGIGIVLQGGGTLSNGGFVTGGVGGSATQYGSQSGTGGSGGAGAALLSAGSVTNGGSISGGAGGYAQGVYASGGNGGIGLELQSGRVDNGGSIRGGNGGFGNADSFATGGAGGTGLALLSTGTLVNSGAITGGSGGTGGAYDGPGTNGAGGVGVSLGGGGTVTNLSAGTISGSGADGIAVSGGAGTIVDAGTIGGTDAIVFGGSYADRVILDPGAVLKGAVIGGSGTNTLELAAGGIGTVSSFGTEFTGFGTVVLDNGAHWLLDDTGAAGQNITLAGTGDVLGLDDTAGVQDPISGFGGGDALDLLDLAYGTGATATLHGSTLNVSSDGTTDSLTLLGLASSQSFRLTQDGSGHVLVTASSTAGTAAMAPRFLHGAASGHAGVTTLDAASHGHGASMMPPLLSQPAAGDLMLGSFRQALARSAVAAAGMGKTMQAGVSHLVPAAALLHDATGLAGDRNALHAALPHHVV